MRFEVVKVKERGSCNNCRKLEISKNPKDAGFKYPYKTVTAIQFGEEQGIEVRLCDECRKELKSKL